MNEKEYIFVRKFFKDDNSIKYPHKTTKERAMKWFNKFTPSNLHPKCYIWISHHTTPDYKIPEIDVKVALTD
jgi:hypothetical protein